MPFTLSHPAAVVPLSRRWFVVSALIVGSMSPDFEYFLRLSTHGRYGHTLPGLFVFCIPSGLVVLWLYHRIIKLPVISLLPISHQERLWPVSRDFAFLPAGRFGVIVVSLFVGALTHVTWDGLTHEEGWFVHHIHALNTVALQDAYVTLPAYRVLQHASTVVGAVVIICWYILWLRRLDPQPLPGPPRPHWARRLSLIAAMVVIAGVTSCIYGLRFVPTIFERQFVNIFAGYAVAFAGMMLFTELVVFGLIWHRCNRTWATEPAEFTALQK